MRTRPCYGFAALLLLVPALLKAQSEDGAPVLNPWEAEIVRFEKADREAPPPQECILFVGSSSIRGWRSLPQDFPDLPVINRGFGGAHLSDVLHFAERIVLPYGPRLILVYGGDNDLASGKTPERVLSDFTALVRKVHAQLPETRIAFLSIKPSLSRWHLDAQIRVANALIERYTDRDDRLLYIDVYTPMLGDDGAPRPELYLGDGLHMKPEGYALWTRIVAPFLPRPEQE